MRLLRSKRSFSELKDQKSEYVTPCDEQESSQARQMDRSEIEVEEERRVRAKRVPVLPTDKEKDESEIVHMTTRRQCETEDSHKCLPKESLVPQVALDRGPFAHGVHMDPVLTQKIHSAVETCQVLHESSETRAVNGVLEDLATCGLGEVLLKRDVGSAIRTLINPAWVGRGDKTMTEKSSKCLHQSNSTSENAVKGIETSLTASDCELPEWFGCRVDSESIAPSRIVGCAVHVLSQSEKRRDDHNVRVRLRTRRSRVELMLTSDTVNPEHVRDEMGKQDPSKATVASEAHDEKTMVVKRILILHRCAQESKRIGERADDREQEEVHLKVPHPKIRRDARQQSVLRSLIATQDNVPRKIRAADQSKRD